MTQGLFTETCDEKKKNHSRCCCLLSRRTAISNWETRAVHDNCQWKAVMCEVFLGEKKVNISSSCQVFFFFLKRRNKRKAGVWDGGVGVFFFSLHTGNLTDEKDDWCKDKCGVIFKRPPDSKQNIVFHLLANLIFLLLYMLISEKGTLACRAALHWLGLQTVVQRICIQSLCSARWTLRDSATVSPHSRWSAATSNSCDWVTLSFVRPLVSVWPRLTPLQV